MKKIFVTDLDGTFLNPNGQVPDNADRFFDYLRGQSYIVVFATARPFGNVLENITKYTKPDWIVCNDGALATKIEAGGVSQTFENNLAVKLVNDNVIFFNENNIRPIFFLGLEHDFDVFLPDNASDSTENGVKFSDKTRSVIRYKRISELPSLDSVRAITLYGENMDQIAGRVRAFNQGKANVMYYEETRFKGKMWLDVISEKSDKFKTSIIIAKKYGVSRIDIALGNGINDLSLISNALWSACPSTSAKRIKSEVDYVAEVPEGYNFLDAITVEMEDR